jgi:hypothetical protein
VTTDTKEIEELRTKHQVRTIQQEDEGLGVDRQPNGVYGFTYSPAEENFPLFSKQDLNSYEAHKLPDGSVLLVGFVTGETANKIEAGRETMTAYLFPVPKEEAAVMVSIPMARVISHTQHSQRQGTGLELQIGPIS